MRPGLSLQEGTLPLRRGGLEGKVVGALCPGNKEKKARSPLPQGPRSNGGGLFFNKAHQYDTTCQGDPGPRDKGWQSLNRKKTIGKEFPPAPGPQGLQNARIMPGWAQQHLQKEGGRLSPALLVGSCPCPAGSICTNGVRITGSIPIWPISFALFSASD